MIRASLIEGRATIAVLASGSAAELERTVAPEMRFGLRAWQPPNLVTMAARTLLEGRSVALFDERGLSGGVMTRITDIADALRDIEQRTRVFDWAPSSPGGSPLVDERDAIEWFVRSRAHVLLVGHVAFEKHAGSQEGGGDRRPRRSLTPRSTPRAA